MTQLPGVALEVIEKLAPMVVAKLQHPWQAGQRTGTMVPHRWP
jgi:hypothetical protein